MDVENMKEIADEVFEKGRIRVFLSAMNCGKEEQLAISQCLDLETTRAWLFCEIDARFIRLEVEESKEERKNEL